VIRILETNSPSRVCDGFRVALGPGVASALLPQHKCQYEYSSTVEMFSYSAGVVDQKNKPCFVQVRKHLH